MSWGRSLDGRYCGDYRDAAFLPVAGEVQGLDLKLPFPWLALGVGLLLALVLIKTGALPGGREGSLPLLTQLIIAEFGFFLTAAGAGMAVRTMQSQGATAALVTAVAGCVLLTAGFLWLGLQLWPGVST